MDHFVEECGCTVDEDGNIVLYCTQCAVNIKILEDWLNEIKEEEVEPDLAGEMAPDEPDETTGLRE